jgi:hypothetical protein
MPYHVKQTYSFMKALCQVIYQNLRKSIVYSIVIIQFIILVRLYVDKQELHLLVNPLLPDTFWHVHLNQQKVSVRAMDNFSFDKHSVLVMACGRDVADALPTFKTNLYSLVSLFKDYHILLGESDSIDNTLAYMQQWQQTDNNVHVYTYGYLRQTYSIERTPRIAYCRNNLLEHARKKHWLTQAQFLLVLDIDINADPILTVDNFRTNFQYDTRDWAAMTASQTQCYYDIWALRTDVVNYDCWKIIVPFKYQDIAQEKYIHIHKKPIPRDFGLIPVQSAFGGFAIYQTQYLNNCYYEGFDRFDREKCEHVTFHECIVRNGGKIFINSRFQNANGIDTQRS